MLESCLKHFTQLQVSYLAPKKLLAVLLLPALSVELSSTTLSMKNKSLSSFSDTGPLKINRVILYNKCAGKLTLI